jgi:cytochrome c oxidase subunit II
VGHSTTEWAYVGVVIALLVWVGAESWRVEHTLEFAPPNSETVRVIGQQWFWSFQHADGTQEVNEVHLKENVPYRFEIVSNDVIHDFAVPDFSILLDAVPGRVNTMWNVFDKPGEYLIECREYCGQQHQTMRAKLFVEPGNGTTAAIPALNNGAQPPSVSTGTGFETVIKPGSNATVTTGTGFERVIKPSEPNPNASNTSAGPSSATNSTNSTSSAVGGPSVALSIPAGASTEGNPSYAPTTLTVKKGDIINVKNDDNAVHTVTSDTTKFDTSLVMAGKSAQIKTSTLAPGDYPYHCTVHAFMKGTITVKA